MQTELNALCENCDSEFSLKYDKSVVSDHENVCCPFCKEFLNTDDSINYQMEDEDILDDNLL